MKLGTRMRLFLGCKIRSLRLGCYPSQSSAGLRPRHLTRLLVLGRPGGRPSEQAHEPVSESCQIVGSIAKRSRTAAHIRDAEQDTAIKFSFFFMVSRHSCDPVCDEVILTGSEADRESAHDGLKGRDTHVARRLILSAASLAVAGFEPI